MNLTISLQQPEKKLALFGAADANLRLIRETLGVSVVARGDEVRLGGESENVSRAAKVLEQLQNRLRRREHLATEDVGNALQTVQDAENRNSADFVDVFARGTRIRAKTEGQRAYLQAIFENDLTFCTGPAGTGKTYLAVAAAAHFLKRHEVKRIVLARPLNRGTEPIRTHRADKADKYEESRARVLHFDLMVLCSQRRPGCKSRGATSASLVNVVPCGPNWCQLRWRGTVGPDAVD